MIEPGERKIIKKGVVRKRRKPKEVVKKPVQNVGSKKGVRVLIAYNLSIILLGAIAELVAILLHFR